MLTYWQRVNPTIDAQWHNACQLNIIRRTHTNDKPVARLFLGSQCQCSGQRYILDRSVVAQCNTPCASNPYPYYYSIIYTDATGCLLNNITFLFRPLIEFPKRNKTKQKLKKRNIQLLFNV